MDVLRNGPGCCSKKGRKPNVAGGERATGRVHREGARQGEKGQRVSGPVGQKRELEFYPTCNGKSLDGVSKEVK